VKKARPTESNDVVGHGELTVDKNAQVMRLTTLVEVCARMSVSK